jgi:hypothetical protein
MAAHSFEHSAKLDRLRIATPCPISWEQMTGDHRVRFCGHCQLNVYNISELSRTKAEKLIASTEGRLCARLYRRDDGTILTKDCPVGLRALRMRVSKRAAAVFAAFASISSVAYGQQSSGKTGCTPQTRISRTYARSNFAVEVLSGTIIDANGAVVPGATITITNLDTKKIDAGESSDEGRFEFKSVAAGSYSIKVEIVGFKSLLVKNVGVEKDTLTSIDMTLELDHATETVGILMAEPSLIDTQPGTTIINEKLIRRLPIQK